MPPRPRLLWAASAWILAASGCDYWRNLIEPKKEDKVDLVLSVKDAWTGEALASAWCSVDGAEALKADSEGRITIPDAPTGRKSVLCTSPSFHPRDMTVEARPGRGRFDIPMACMGGEQWYPDDPARHVRIDMLGGSLLFPGVVVVRGLPGGAAEGVFQYAWTSSHHAGLRSNDTVTIPTKMQAGDSLEFLLSLIVTANLAGNSYEVGRISQTFTLLRNRPPTLTPVFSPAGPVRVGAGCKDNKFALLFPNAVDPDGECRIRIRSRKANSPLGLIDTTAVCENDQSFYFPIFPHVGHPEEIVTRDGTLDVEVTDDNEGKTSASFNVATYSNLHPTIQIGQVDASFHNLTGEPLKFLIKAEDRDTMFLQEVSVDWKNGIVDAPVRGDVLKKSYRYERTLTHIFEDAGTYIIEAKVRDACEVLQTATTEITLVDNRIPWVRLKPGAFNSNTGEYEVEVDASDDDVGGGMDTLLTVIVRWGPITTDWAEKGNLPILGRMIRERVSIPFARVSDATGYGIRVSVQDQFRAVSWDTLNLSPQEAFGAP